MLETDSKIQNIRIIERIPEYKIMRFIIEYENKSCSFFIHYESVKY